MLTAAKLIGAILFAALAWFVTEQVKEVMPSEGRGAGLLSPINALVGLVMGWRIIGTRAGDGYTPSLGYGLTTVFITTVNSLVIWSGYTMINRAVSGRYRGPLEALEGMGNLFLDYWVLVAHPDVIGAAVLGSIVCAWVTEYFSHRWS